MTIVIPESFVIGFSSVTGCYFAIGLVIGLIHTMQANVLCKFNPIQFVFVYIVCVLMWLPMLISK